MAKQQNNIELGKVEAINRACLCLIRKLLKLSTNSREIKELERN